MAHGKRYRMQYDRVQRSKLYPPAEAISLIKQTSSANFDETVEVATGTALWHRAGQPPLPVRWVLARSPEHSWRHLALFSTTQQVSAEQILCWYLLRWNVEAPSHASDVRASARSMSRMQFRWMRWRA